MEEQQRQQIKKYIGVVWRRKVMILSFLLVALTAGLGVYLKTPKVYESTALIIYQRQRVNPSKMSPDEQSSHTRDMVNTLSQQVTARSSLEALIKQFDLYGEMRQKMPMEDVVDAMRKHINIRPQKGDVFHVSFDGPEPKKVMLVTNAVASRFIEENLRFREEKATETSIYVKDELSMAKEALDKKEEIMRDYKLKYYNEMPQQLQTNMTRLNALQGQYQNAQEGIRDLEKTRLLIQEQMNIRKEMITQAQMLARQGKIDAVSAARTAKQMTPEEEKLLRDRQELEQLKEALNSLLLRYTDQHPEVRRISRKIEILEKNLVQKQSETNSDLSSGSTTGGEGSAVKGMAESDLIDPQLKQLELQLKEIGINIDQGKKEIVKINEQIKQYQEWIDATPVREAEWAALTRDYEQLHNHYQDLLRRNIEADAVQNLERRQKGSQFKIVDSAHFPEKPASPNFKKIMLLAAALGLGLGGGLGVLLELVDTSFKDPNELESFIGVPVVCAIPVVSTAHDKRMKKIKALAVSAFFFIAGCGLVGGMALLWKKGLIII